MMIYVFWSCKEVEEAKKITHLLLEKKLIACASFFPVESLYVWDNSIKSDKEIKVLLKTQKKHFQNLCTFIIEHSSYTTPEITAINVDEAQPSYLAWLQDATS